MQARRTGGSGRVTVAAALALGFLAAAGCGSSPITAGRIEQAVAPTFANLVHEQLLRIDLPPVAPSDITVIAGCRRNGGGVGHPAVGAGDWTCTFDWHGPNRQPLRDTYDLAVGTDGCYTATVEGAESQVGGPSITTPGGVEMRNLLYAFDGCFDLR